MRSSPNSPPVRHSSLLASLTFGFGTTHSQNQKVSREQAPEKIQKPDRFSDLRLAS